jgi:hypothetical protein
MGHNRIKHIHICFNGKNLSKKLLAHKNENLIKRSQVVKVMVLELLGPH